MTFLLAQIRPENLTSSYRSARPDLTIPAARRHVKRNIVKGGIYYSNTTLINGVDPLHPLEGVRAGGG